MRSWNYRNEFGDKFTFEELLYQFDNLVKENNGQPVSFLFDPKNKSIEIKTNDLTFKFTEN